MNKCCSTVCVVFVCSQLSYELLIIVVLNSSAILIQCSIITFLCNTHFPCRSPMNFCFSLKASLIYCVILDGHLSHADSNTLHKVIWRGRVFVFFLPVNNHSNNRNPPLAVWKILLNGERILSLWIFSVKIVFLLWTTDKSCKKKKKDEVIFLYHASSSYKQSDLHFQKYLI